MFDIDYFKQVNDTFGHQIGDLVLREVANRLNHHSRYSDIVFRYGGDEFCIIMPETTAETAKLTIDRLRRGIGGAEITTIEDHKIRVTVSAGVASCAGEPTTAAELIGRADANLYAAKESGRNRVVTDEEAA
jgi:diguanylate cyclase (GGDEF)-like protein